ncbi:acyltransferase family protein [Adhaeribacter radiodurans]|uniref:Acyltransferase n=1 Tax=Adhaeribacter radiodurans TaxID=2745197 RepID=A0A7L7L3Q9_9BACT|nr:acyltransferase [Adhaeribacter radiodurans]QMU27436.1 acyltransferase [Adhaeribacter radiodurans]
MQNRDASADILKCISIFGVVFIHGNGLLSGDTQFGKCFESLFRFCVPVFIVFWSFFFEVSLQKGKSLYPYSKAKLTHLFIVFFIWSAVYFFLTEDWFKITFVKAITKYWLGYGWAGQYFFIILFQLIVFFFVLRKIYDHKHLLYLTITCSIIIFVIYGYWYHVMPTFIKSLGDRPVVFWIVFAILGIHLARNPNFKGHWVCCLGVILIPLEFWFLNANRFEHSAYITPAVLISSSLLIYGFVRLPIRLDANSFYGRSVKYVGQNTMTIFVMNPLVITLLEPFTKPLRIIKGTEFFELSLAFVSAILVCFICLVASFLINHSKLKGIIN